MDMAVNNVLPTVRAVVLNVEHRSTVIQAATSTTRAQCVSESALASGSRLILVRAWTHDYAAV